MEEGGRTRKVEGERGQREGLKERERRREEGGRMNRRRGSRRDGGGKEEEKEDGKGRWKRMQGHYTRAEDKVYGRGNEK